jgi:hypothetical protein
MVQVSLAKFLPRLLGLISVVGIPSAFLVSLIFTIFTAKDSELAWGILVGAPFLFGSIIFAIVSFLMWRTQQ